MATERSRVSDLATWTGGQLKAVRTYADQAATAAAAAVKAEILGGASSAYDTLQELKALLDAAQASDANALSVITTALAKRVRFDAAQTLTGPEQVQARANIGAISDADLDAELGATDTDYVALATAALNS